MNTSLDIPFLEGVAATVAKDTIDACIQQDTLLLCTSAPGMLVQSVSERLRVALKKEGFHDVAMSNDDCLFVIKKIGNILQESL